MSQVPPIVNSWQEEQPLVPPERSRLADAAYLLACAGPLSFVVYALGRMDRHPLEAMPSGWSISLGVLLAASPLGVVLGLIGLWRIPVYLVGRHRARAAVIVGLSSCGAIVLFGPGLMQMDHYDGARTASCMSNVKLVGLALLMYSQDNDDRLPLHNNWNDSIFPYCKNHYIFICPSASDTELPSYGFNRRLAAQHTNWVNEPAVDVLVFESAPGANRSGGKELLPDPPRHSGGYNFGFLDGHMKYFKSKEGETLRWRPTITPPRQGKGSNIGQ